jgi:hypothetical protein
VTLPFLFLGFAAMFQSGMTVRTMREQIRELPSAARKPNALV